MRSLLRQPDAQLLVAGQLVSMFGDWALVLVLGIWAKALTGSSAAAGLVFFTFAVAALLAPFGGWVADRVRRKPLMIWTNTAIAVVILSLLFVHGRNELWLIYVVTFLYGLAGDLFSAAQDGLLRTMLSDDLLVDARALLQTAFQGLRLVAPLAGAGLYSVFGGGAVAVLDAATFAVSVLTLKALHVDEPDPQPGSERFVTQLAAGARHIVRTPVLRQIVIGIAVAFLVIGFDETVVFVVIDRVLHRPPSFFGVLATLQGAGSILGGLTAARLLRRIGDTKLVGVGLLVFAAGDLLFLVPHLPAVLCGFFIAGVGLPWLVVAFSVAMQVRTPLAVQGRVSAAANVAISVPQAISIATGAALSTLVDYRILVVVIGVVTVLAGAWLATRRELVPESRPAPAPTRTAFPGAAR